MKLTLIDSAIASDGGSIGLSLHDQSGNECHVLLDKGINSATKNRIFTDNFDQPLTSDQEAALLLRLEGADSSEQACDELLKAVIYFIQQKQAST